MNDRLFFALWPDERLLAALREQIARLTSGITGRLQRPDQWHVTLEFLGAVPVDRQPALRQAAARVRMPSCELSFDRIEHWIRPRVVCLVTDSPPSALVDLVANLRVALAHEGFTPDQRPFRPHVTVARKVGNVPERTLVEPIRWPAERFALVRSLTTAAGSRYEPAGWWNGAVEGGRESGVSG